METRNHNSTPDIPDWWESRRKKYNMGLIISGIISYILYVILGSILIAPHDYEFEITIFNFVFQGFLFMIVILIANLFYNLGAFTDKHFNKRNEEKFRQRIYNLGFWFSVALPFLIPILIVIEYFTCYANLK